MEEAITMIIITIVEYFSNRKKAAVNSNFNKGDKVMYSLSYLIENDLQDTEDAIKVFEVTNVTKSIVEICDTVSINQMYKCYEVNESSLIKM